MNTTPNTLAYAALIAAQNDAFRAQLMIPVFGKPAVSGRCVITSGIAALGPVAQIEIAAKVRGFDQFDRDNDPHGERDFGAFDYNGEKVFWKIDYYDPTLTMGSEDPADLAKTHRVLTIMLASEY